MANLSEDPYYAVRNNVAAITDKIKMRYEKFLDMVKTCDTANDSNFKDFRKGLSKDLRAADRQIKDLKGAVDMVQKNREKFPHINDGELGTRQQFVDDTQRTLNDLKSGMESPSVRRKMEEDEAKLRRTTGGMSNNSRQETKGSNANAGFIANQRVVTQQNIDEQDVHLEALGNAADRLNAMGGVINQELREQNLMLDQLDNDIDDAQGKMNFVLEGLSKLLKTRDGCQIWAIIILSLILVILIALVIYL